MRSYVCCSQTQTSDDVVALATTLRVISEPNRLRILCVLQAEAEHCVCELMEHLPDVSQSLLSHHLADLKTAGLVESEKRGAKVYYQLSDNGAAVTKTVLSLTKKGQSL